MNCSPIQTTHIMHNVKGDVPEYLQSCSVEEGVSALFRRTVSKRTRHTCESMLNMIGSLVNLMCGKKIFFGDITRCGRVVGFIVKHEQFAKVFLNPDVLYRIYHLSFLLGKVPASLLTDSSPGMVPKRWRRDDETIEFEDDESDSDDDINDVELAEEEEEEEEETQQKDEATGDAKNSKKGTVSIRDVTTEMLSDDSRLATLESVRLDNLLHEQKTMQSEKENVLHNVESLFYFALMIALKVALRVETVNKKVPDFDKATDSQKRDAWKRLTEKFSFLNDFKKTAFSA